MYLGVDYYPEQWDGSMLDGDLDRIKELGSNVIRIAEFAWHLMEKKEGDFDFSYFDRVIARAKEKGLNVIMGTPTATIPAWLAKKHPDILSEFEDGSKRVFGGRRVYCFNSEHMYEYSEKIIRKMVSHYKGEKAIVAWQVDNEIGHEGSDLCYCENCKRKFRSFLSDKFGGDIDKLNKTYGTAFWSQEYNSFDEIPLPARTVTTHNPALRLDWERFRNKSVVDFMAFQSRLIKECDPDAFVIHDFAGGGLEKHFDYSEVAKTVDKSAFNNYPVWGGQKEPVPPHGIAFGLDYIRGLKGENFWITEAIMGAQGHDVTGFLPRPEQAKMWSYQAMAHGCESLMYFRYRGAAKGAEQFCYGIIDADNIKGRKFREVQEFFSDVSKYPKEFESPINNRVAIVYGFESLASFRIQRQSLLLDVETEMKRYYRTFFRGNIGVDVIPEDRDFSGYGIVILSHLTVTKPETAKKVKDFVSHGGTVILTYRCDVKDTDNNIPFGKRLPVNYHDIAGIYIIETESLQERGAFPVVGESEFEGQRGSGGIFRDMIEPDGAETLFRYGDKFYGSFSAVTRNRVGGGSVYYIGCGLDDGTLDAVLKCAMTEQGIAARPTPDGVEVVQRGDIVMYINHNEDEVNFDGMTLAPFECKIVG